MLPACIDKKKLLIAVSTLLLICIGCSAPISQFYPGSYFRQDNIYQNKVIGFLLQFPSGWDLVTAPEKMDKATRGIARELHNRGAELLFIGSSPAPEQAVRAIAINLNVSSRIYAEKIREMNDDGVDKDHGLSGLTISGQQMYRWDYEIDGFRFAEFFFTIDTYNVRVAFWTRPPVFQRFEAVYLEIIGSLSSMNRF